MAWHIVEKTIEHLDQHATLAGKFWITFFFVFRFLLVISIADTIFGDEASGFKCDTQTPGCVNVCFNTFTPISLFRFWALQLLASALPGIVLYVYIANKVQSIEVAKKIRKKREDIKKQERKDLKRNRRDILNNQRSARRRHKKMQKERENEAQNLAQNGGRASVFSQKTNSNIGGSNMNSNANTTTSTSSSSSSSSSDSEEYWLGNDDIVASKLTSRDMPPKVFLAYEAHVIARMVIEIIFIVMQYYIYPFKFRVPERYECAHFERPCLNRHTSCYIARPREKTVFIALMYGTAVFMILLSLYELYSLGIRNTILALKYRTKDITKEYRIDNSKNHHFLVNTTNNYKARNARSVASSRAGRLSLIGERVEIARSSLSGPGADLDNDKWVP